MCTAPGFLDTSLAVIMRPPPCSARAPRGRRRGAVAVALDEPLPVVALLEGKQGAPQLLHGLETSRPRAAAL